MSDQHNPDRERLFDLLADRAVQPLTDAETEELNGLLKRFDDVDEREFELDFAASAMTSAFESSSSDDSLPPALAAKLQGDAITFFSKDSALQTPQSSPAVESTPGAQSQVESTIQPSLSASTNSSSGFSVREAIAWFTAAAALLFALGIFDKRPVQPNEPVVPTLSQKLDSLKESAADLIDIEWQVLDDPSTKTDGEIAASGRVAWSTKSQEGFMSIAGLEQNDPSISQYQLWIFDKNQEDPIDGGVFDVTGNDVIIPIDSKLQTVDVYQFAVTIEKPGGVVKSKKERIALLAQL